MKRHQLDLHRRIKQNYLSVLDKPILAFTGEYVVARELLDDYVRHLSSEKENGNK